MGSSFSILSDRIVQNRSIPFKPFPPPPPIRSRIEQQVSRHVLRQRGEQYKTRSGRGIGPGEGAGGAGMAEGGGGAAFAQRRRRVGSQSSVAPSPGCEFSDHFASGRPRAGSCRSERETRGGGWRHLRRRMGSAPRGAELPPVVAVPIPALCGWDHRRRPRGRRGRVLHGDEIVSSETSRRQGRSVSSQEERRQSPRESRAGVWFVRRSTISAARRMPCSGIGIGAGGKGEGEGRSTRSRRRTRTGARCRARMALLSGS